MENTETINIRGSINALEVDEAVALSRRLCKVSSVRTIAGMITTDTGKTFSVSATADPDNVVVTRIS